MGKHSASNTGRTNAAPRRASQSRSTADSPTPKPVGGGHYFSRSHARNHVKRNDGIGKKRTYVVVGVLVAILIVVGAIAVVNHFFEAKSSNQPANGTKVSITVEQGESAKSVAATLEEAGLVKSANSFLDFITDKKIASKLKPGTYAMTVGMSNEELAAMLVEGPAFDGIALSIPEGQTIEQIAARVESVCSIPAAEFSSLAHNASAYASAYPFLNGVYNNSMEGFLFPKTYDVAKGATADDIIRMMLDQFAEEVRGIDLTDAKSKNLDLFDVVTIASCIEEEAFFEEDRATISSVIYNRLSQGIRLGLDVTVSYAVGKSGEELTQEDLDIDSPYNTRKNYGLPAGPISSPGLASLQAAAHPAQTDYLYFILTNEKSEFYVTYEDFVAGKAAWKASGA